ncbi:hypothetical protein BGZ83_008468 [Gryganskiella cystojenkinii]|nr:hypothetical protein BGZ83_008468 [Gryganskiella cystojenkinii]
MAQFLDFFPNPIRTLVLPERTIFETLGCQALKGRHFKSLQFLKLESASSPIIQQILSSCPKLLEFRGNTLHIRDVVKDWGQGRIVKRTTTTATVSVRAEAKSSKKAHFLLFQKVKNIIRVPTAAVEVRAPLPPSSQQSQTPPRLQPPKLIDPPPQPDHPWVCLRLRLLWIKFSQNTDSNALVDDDEDPIANLKIFQQLCQLRHLESLQLGKHGDPIIGLNPMACLAMLEDVNETIGPGTTAQTMSGLRGPQSKLQKYTIRRRLLKIWPN